jgi:hypothetical protein
MGIGHWAAWYRGAFLLFTFAFFLFTWNCPAQEDPFELAPPPLKFVSKDDKIRLESMVDLKAKTKLAVELMNDRIDNSEKANSDRDYDGLFRELGRFRGLVDYTLGYLGRGDQNDKRVLDSYKRLEISLRAFTARIEVIRRELPIKYEEYPRDLMKYLRDARTKALEPQFSDTVVPDVKPDR